MQQKAAEAGKFLRSNYDINAPRDWLEACLEWMINEEYSVIMQRDLKKSDSFILLQNVNLSQSDINTNVYDQWLSSDLNEIGSSCFPEDIKTIQKSPKSFLNGTYPVQVRYI